MENNILKNKKQERNKYHYLYPIADFILSFVIVLISFLTYLWSSIKSGTVSNDMIIVMFAYSAGIALITIVVLWLFKVYKMLTRDFGFSEALFIAILVFAINVVGIIFLEIFQYGISGISCMSIWSWLLATIALCACIPSLRLCSRLFRRINAFKNRKEKIPTIVIGAGALGKLLANETISSTENNNKIVCFVDDDTHLFGTTLAGAPVYGPISDIATFVEQYHAQEVIIAVSNISQIKIKEIAKNLESLPVRLKRTASLEKSEGPNAISSFNVDVNELLFRGNVLLDNSTINTYLRDKVVLVTGAGGSIGSELVRQIFASKPKQIILFDIYENSLYDIEQELKGKMRRENIFDISIKTIVGSTYNADRVEWALNRYHPDIIYHAAAYKHVPLMESAPMEAIRTNVIGTYNVARLADKYKVNKMILISTDKAVRPTSAMGATKRFAEMIIQTYAKRSNVTTYAAVRFGNVLGSNGSVIPLFKKQIEAGGPVTITDKEIIRYFMTIPEAVSLILQSSLFAKMGEIFILDMGEPVKIIDLAERMIRQTGLVPYKDIDIVSIGLRPGEKKYEELLLDKSKHQKTSNEKIYIEPAEGEFPIEEEIEIISKVFDMKSRTEMKELLKTIITTYTPDSRS